MICTALVGLNEDLFPQIVSLHIPPGSIVADVTHGKGRFWNKIDTSAFTMLCTDLTDGIDFRSLPYADASVDVQVFDPPYLYNASKTVKASIADTYSINDSLDIRTNEDVLALYRGGIMEAARVVKHDGTLIVKCQDTTQHGIPEWNHIAIAEFAKDAGFLPESLFVLVQPSLPAQRWKIQKRARRNHSYFWIFVKPARRREFLKPAQRRSKPC